MIWKIRKFDVLRVVILLDHAVRKTHDIKIVQVNALDNKWVKSHGIEFYVNASSCIAKFGTELVYLSFRCRIYV